VEKGVVSENRMKMGTSNVKGFRDLLSHNKELSRLGAEFSIKIIANILKVDLSLPPAPGEFKVLSR